MTAETDAKLIEEGRKLFAGEWTFIWASPSIETLPPMAGVEVALCLALFVACAWHVRLRLRHAAALRALGASAA
jgi:hypothetical protein